MRIPYAVAIAAATALGAVGVIGMQAMAQQTPQQAEEAAPPAAGPRASPEADRQGPGERRGWRGDDRRGDGPRDEGRRTERYDQLRPSDEDRAAFLAARLAAVRAGLLLSPEQDRLWPAVEDAARNMIDVARDGRSRMRGDEPPTDRIARMRRMGEFAKARGEALIRLADAAEPLYATLSDDQKRRLRILTRRSGLEGIAGRAMGGGRHMDHHRGHQMDHHADGALGRHGERRGRMDERSRRGHRDYDRREGGRDSRDGQRHLRHGTDWTGEGFDRGAYIGDWRTL